LKTRVDKDAIDIEQRLSSVKMISSSTQPIPNF
jgi:hypothetical protein